MAKKLSAMVVDSDAEGRINLREFAAAIPDFGKMQLASTLAEALGNLNNPRDSQPELDLVFISHRFEIGSINQFVQLAKDTAKGRAAAYILILRSAAEKGEVTSSVLQGADGVLVEPFSSAAIYELLALSESVKRQRHVERGEALVDFLSTDVIRKIDQIAALQVAGSDPSQAIEELRNLSKIVADLGPDKAPLYQKRVIGLLEAAKPNPEIEELRRRK